MTGRLLKAALVYSDRKWPVFPVHGCGPAGGCDCLRGMDCSSPAKHPWTRDGFKSATTDPEQIRRWWAQWPQANIGLPTGKRSGVFVLDIDPRHGGDASLVELEDRHEVLPETLKVRTGGGGWHLYFLYPEGAEVRNAVELAGLPGLDIRGTGDYVLLPPSIHATGEAYRWVRPTGGAQ